MKERARERERERGRENERERKRKKESSALFKYFSAYNITFFFGIPNKNCLL